MPIDIIYHMHTKPDYGASTPLPQTFSLLKIKLNPNGLAQVVSHPGILWSIKSKVQPSFWVQTIPLGQTCGQKPELYLTRVEGVLYMVSRLEPRIPWLSKKKKKKKLNHQNLDGGAELATLCIKLKFHNWIVSLSSI